MEEFNKETIHKLKARTKKGGKEEIKEEPTVKICPYCLSEIPYKAIKCAHCASNLENKEGKN